MCDDLILRRSKECRGMSGCGLRKGVEHTVALEGGARMGGGQGVCVRGWMGGYVRETTLASTVSTVSLVSFVEAGKLKEKDLTVEGSSVKRSPTLHHESYT